MVRRHGYCSARARAAARSSEPSLGSRVSTASASDAGSGRPAAPDVASTSSCAPPRLEVTTGVPQASASNTANPKVSAGQTDSEMSAAAIRLATSGRPATKPWKDTGASPAAAWSSAWSGPVP